MCAYLQLPTALPMPCCGEVASECQLAAGRHVLNHLSECACPVVIWRPCLPVGAPCGIHSTPTLRYHHCRLHPAIYRTLPINDGAGRFHILHLDLGSRANCQLFCTWASCQLFWDTPRAENALPPVQALGPHVSPLGLTFYPTYSQGLPATKAYPWPRNAWPEQYRGRLFVAEHGSWNRREPIGYRIAMVQVKVPGVWASVTCSV